MPAPTLREIERDAILARLTEFGGSRQLAALTLKISVRKLQMKLKEYRAAGMAVPRSDRRRLEPNLPD